MSSLRTPLVLSVVAALLPLANCACPIPPTTDGGQTQPDAGPTPLDAGFKQDAGGEDDDAGVVDTRTLVIEPDTQSALVGESLSFSAFLEDELGVRENVTGVAVWSVGDPVAFMLQAPGVVLILGAGETEVSAKIGEKADLATAVGLAPDANVVALAVEPGVLDVPEGVSLAVSTIAIYSNGQTADVTALSTWQSLSPGVVEVEVGADGLPLLVGVAAGTGQVRTSFAGIDLDATVRVLAAVLEAIEVVPADSSVPVGANLELDAIGRYADGELFNLTGEVVWSSSDPAVASVEDGTVTGVMEGSTEVTATFGAVVGAADVSVTPAEIWELSIQPPLIRVPAGSAVNVQATALLTSTIVAHVTEEALWSLGNPEAALLTGGPGTGQPFRLEGVFPAETTLTAVYAGETTTAAVTITDADLSFVELLPGSQSLPAGVEQQFALVGTWSDGSVTNLTPDSLWTTSDASIALVLDSPAGRVSAVAPGGPVSITASFGDFTETAEVIVTDATVVSVQVNPPLVTVPVGESASFNAIGVYSDNSQRLITGDVTWTVDEESIASISNALGQRGTAMGVAPGAATVTATLGGLSDTAALNITDAVVDEIIVIPFFILTNPGHIEQLQALALYSNGTTLNVTQDAVWLSSNAEIFQVSNAPGSIGRITGIAPGVSNVVASYGGTSGSADVNVTANAFANLAIVPPQLFVAPGLTAQLGLVGQYENAPPQAFENLTAFATWASLDESIATVDNFPGGAGVLTGVAPGMVTVTATYEGEEVTRQVLVQDLTVDSLEIAPPSPVVPVDAVQPFVALAEFSDGVTRDVTGDATFTSGDNTLLTVIQAFSGLAIALAPGSTTVTATLGVLTSQTDVTVIDAAPELVVLSPAGPIVDQFEQPEFYATALYDDGSTGDLTYLCSWSSSNSDVLIVFDEPFAKGRSFAASPGIATVTVDCFGLVDSTLVTVQ